jgi:hypothetical protein
MPQLLYYIHYWRLIHREIFDLVVEGQKVDIAHSLLFTIDICEDLTSKPVVCVVDCDNG